MIHASVLTYLSKEPENVPADVSDVDHELTPSVHVVQSDINVVEPGDQEGNQHPRVHCKPTNAHFRVIKLR